mmetsp:Transcript_128391/g.256451  ORF Transcript_128391/g.256451 Transcript_128391/m.256451 type:complete len:514 (+) Transcript_128391:121-1662(+)
MGMGCSQSGTKAGISAASHTSSSPQSSPSGGAHMSATGSLSNAVVPEFATADDEAPENNMLGSLPPFFSEILEDIERHQRLLGGLKYFQQRPHIERKMKRQELASSHSDYEYIYLTVLGLARLHLRSEEIIRRNNGQPFNRNPGVQLLEHVTGFTMHAEREGANHVLRQAPACLVEAYQLARAEAGGTLTFYKSAFDRTADPCLEGRFGRLIEYIERRRASSDPKACRGPSWEDVTLKTLPQDVSAQEVVGEHLRVFIAECTWQWAQERGLSYEEATGARQEPEQMTDFARLFNAASFEAAMIARGVVLDTDVFQWESASKCGEWVPYEPEVSKQIDVAHQRGVAEIRIRLGPKCWQYIIDFNRMVQRNPKTGQERPLRNVAAASSDARTKPGQLTLEILQRNIQYFVDMQTLPPVPGVPGQVTTDHSWGTGSAVPVVDATKAHEDLEEAPCIGEVHGSSEVPPDPPLLPRTTSSEPAQHHLDTATQEPASQQEVADDEHEERSPEMKLIDVP